MEARTLIIIYYPLLPPGLSVSIDLLCFISKCDIRTQHMLYDGGRWCQNLHMSIECWAIMDLSLQSAYIMTYNNIEALPPVYPLDNFLCPSNPSILLLISSTLVPNTNGLRYNAFPYRDLS